MRRGPVLAVTLSALTLGGALAWRYWPDAGAARLADTRALYDWCYGSLPPLPPTDDSREGRIFDRAASLSEGAVREAAGHLMPTPTDDERASVADDIEATIVARYSPLRAGEALASVRRVEARLNEALPRSRGAQPTFAVLNTPSRNAFMAPGARGFVLRGLIDHMADAARLAFVLGPEIAHAELGHDEEIVRAAIAGRELGANAGVPDDVGTQLGAAAARLPMMLYDQRREFAADRYALCLATRAGFDPLRVASAVPRLSDGTRPAPLGVSRLAYDIVATHPPAAARQRYLATLLERLRRR